MPAAARHRRRLLALVVVLAMSAVACGGNDGDEGTRGRGERTTTTAAGTGGSDSPGADGGDGASGVAGEPGSNVPSGLSDTKTVPLSVKDLPKNEHGAPLPGRYTYDVDGADRPVVVDVLDTLGDQQEDSFDRTGDLGQVHIEYEGAEARATLLQWRADGVRLDAEQRAQNTQSGTEEGAVCDYRPDLLLQGAPLRLGARTTDRSTCSSTQGDVTLTRERTVTTEVVARSTAQVGGRSVDTLRLKRVIDTTTTADSTPPLLLTERRELTIEWIVAVGLAARVEGTILDTVGGSAKPPRLYTWTLRSTEPQE